jgi:hypothetical protein
MVEYKREKLPLQGDHIVMIWGRGLCVTYKKGFGLVDWIIAPYTFTQLESAIVDLHSLQFTVAHALGFSVFTGHILAADLSQSCSFSAPPAGLLMQLLYISR